MLGALAEFERDLIIQRTKAGMQAARKRGQHLGRPRKLDGTHLDHAKELIDQGKCRSEAARLLKVDPSTLYRVFKRCAETRLARPAWQLGRSKLVNESISTTSRSWVWTDSFSWAPGWLMVLLSILAIITVLMWIFLPFAIYGVKAILREQNARLSEIQRLLQDAHRELKSSHEVETLSKTPDTRD